MVSLPYGLLLASGLTLIVLSNSAMPAQARKNAKPAGTVKSATNIDDSVEITEEWSNPEEKGKRTVRFQHKGNKYIVGINKQIDAAYIANVKKNLLNTKNDHRPSLQELGVSAKTLKLHRQEIQEAAMIPLLRARIKDPEKYLQEPTLEVVSKIANRVRDEKPSKGLMTTNVIKFHGNPEVTATSEPLYAWRVKVGSHSWTTYSFTVSQQLGKLLALAYGGRQDDAKQYWTATFWQSEALWECLITKEGNKKIDDKIRKNLERMFPKGSDATTSPDASPKAPATVPEEPKESRAK